MQSQKVFSGSLLDKSKNGYIIRLQGITVKDIKENMSLFEKIFHKKELAFLQRLLPGDSVNLTSRERKVILDALVHPAYEEKVSEPKISYEFRQAYKRAKEKIAMVEAYHRKKK